MKIFLVGFMGAGKSAIGRLLAKSMNLTFYDLDSEIEATYKMSVSSIFKNFDEACFRKLEHKTLLSFCEKDNFVMSCGGGTPCFCDNMEFMNSLGTTVYIKLPPDALASRISESVKKRPLTEGKSDDELLKYVETTLSGRETFYSKAKITVDGVGVGKDELVGRIAEMICDF